MILILTDDDLNIQGRGTRIQHLGLEDIEEDYVRRAAGEADAVYVMRKADELHSTHYEFRVLKRSEKNPLALDPRAKPIQVLAMQVLADTGAV